MAELPITGFTELTTPAVGDLLCVVSSSAGATTYKMTTDSLLTLAISDVTLTVLTSTGATYTPPAGARQLLIADKGGDYDCYDWSGYVIGGSTPVTSGPVCMTAAGQTCDSLGTSSDCSSLGDQNGNPTNMSCRDRFTGAPKSNPADPTGVWLDDRPAGPSRERPTRASARRTLARMIRPRPGTTRLTGTSWPRWPTRRDLDPGDGSEHAQEAQPWAVIPTVS